MRSVSAVRTWVVVVSSLLLVAGLAARPRASDLLSGIEPTFVLTIHDANLKLSPAAVEDDGDIKDVKVRTRAPYKPSKGDEPDLAKRMKLGAAKSGGDATISTFLEAEGDVSTNVLVAVDALDGLLDGETAGFLERRPTDGGPVLRVEAVWDAALDGFTTRAFVDGVQQGDDFDVAGHEVRLLMFDFGDDIVLQASGESEGQTLATHPQDGSGGRASWALGARDLGPKGALYFSQLQIEFPIDVSVGDVETETMVHLYMARGLLDDAIALVDEGSTNVELISILVSNAADHLSFGSGSTGLLESALAEDALEPQTQGAQAFQVSKHGLGQAIAAFGKLGALVAAGKTSGKPALALVTRARDDAHAAMGLVLGFKTKSPKRLAKIMTITVGF